MRMTLLAALVLAATAAQPARAQEVLKVAIPQRGAWDSGVAELGQRAGIFKQHGLTLEVLFTQGGPESSRRSSAAASMSRPRPARRPRSGPSPRGRRCA